ncbi:hypothetical protein R6L23_16420 [Streptomyces sp. SR27]|uniref:hypothetical protein n=1 Tax=Streptomyces sp. SR27 TaxID=3076630 RepID=UPI00295B8727|nr:hypothetical protein [Streptomyces sp. SR27]MDV9189781.1 hypothetical protein [Streptomyces sp. SR27]
MLSHVAFAFSLSAAQVQEIFARLSPHLPSYLKKVEPGPSGYGVRFEFAPFTGAEPRPEVPAAFHRDPGLTGVSESENPVEHRLREAADQIITDLYDTAHHQWEDAAYVRELKGSVKDAPALWVAYKGAAEVLETAYAYLRTPEASQEWPSAVARLLDAQDNAVTAADAFDLRAQDIAEVHNRHLYADLSHDAALAQAGYPEAKDWDIADSEKYGYRSYGWDDSEYAPLATKVRRLVERQQGQLEKVTRLSGAPAPADTVPGPRRHG